MSFSSQYKTEMNQISPSEEQLARLREVVDRQLSQKRKPLYMRIAAVSGAAAAVLVIGFAVIFAVPRMSIGMDKAAEGELMNGGGAAAPGDIGESANNIQFGMDLDAAENNADGAATRESDILVELDGSRAFVAADGERYAYEFSGYEIPGSSTVLKPAVTDEGLEIFVYFDENKLLILYPEEERAQRFTAVN